MHATPCKAHAPGNARRSWTSPSLRDTSYSHKKDKQDCQKLAILFVYVSYCDHIIPLDFKLYWVSSGLRYLPSNSKTLHLQQSFVTFLHFGAYLQQQPHQTCFCFWRPSTLATIHVNRAWFQTFKLAAGLIFWWTHSCCSCMPWKQQYMKIVSSTNLTQNLGNPCQFQFLIIG